MFFGKCGNQINQGEKFCGKCGAAVNFKQTIAEKPPLVQSVLQSKPYSMAQPVIPVKKQLSPRI